MFISGMKCVMRCCWPNPRTKILEKTWIPWCCAAITWWSSGVSSSAAQKLFSAASHHGFLPHMLRRISLQQRIIPLGSSASSGPSVLPPRHLRLIRRCIAPTQHDSLLDPGYEALDRRALPPGPVYHPPPLSQLAYPAHRHLQPESRPSVVLQCSLQPPQRRRSRVLVLLLVGGMNWLLSHRSFPPRHVVELIGMGA